MTVFSIGPSPLAGKGGSGGRLNYEDIWNAGYAQGKADAFNEALEVLKELIQELLDEKERR